MKKIWDTIIENILEHKQLIIISFILLFSLYIGYEYYFRFSYIMENPSILKEIVLSYGDLNILVFIFMQIIQVVIFFIPGEFIQVAGGYIFGTFAGSVISLIGITLGSVIVYAIANNYGKPFVEKVILDKKVKFFRKILKVGSKKIVVFMFYLIPGIPKDALTYICGVSDISLKDFFVYSTFGRIPGIFISSYFGEKMYARDFTSLITIGVAMSLIFILGVFKGNIIIKNMIKNKKTF